MTILDSTQIAADYAEVFARRGEAVSIRRYSGTPGARTHADTAAWAKVTEFAPDQLVGAIVQGDRKVILLIDAAVAAILPLTTSDKLVVRGRELAIKAIDDNTRRNGATGFALDIVAGG